MICDGLVTKYYFKHKNKIKIYPIFSVVGIEKECEYMSFARRRALKEENVYGEAGKVVDKIEGINVKRAPAATQRKKAKEYLT